MKQQGFTIVELLIVIIIIAILGVIALPQFLNAQDRGKQSQTIANLRNIASAMALYHADENEYPVASTIGSLKSVLEDIYMEIVPTLDGWNNEFYVDSSSLEYTMGSCGKSTTSCSSLTLINGVGGSTNNFTDDIIIRNGSFIQYPVGVQQ